MKLYQHNSLPNHSSHFRSISFPGTSYKNALDRQLGPYFGKILNAAIPSSVSGPGWQKRLVLAKLPWQ